MLIGEVSRRSGVSVRMLRHYDRIGLVRPSGRTGTGYRRYESEDLRRLFRVEALRSLGLSLEQAGRALDDPDFDAAGMIADLIAGTVRRIAAERELLARLREIESSEPHSWQEALGVVDLLSTLRSGGSAQRQAAALRSGVTATAPPDPLVEIYLSESEEGVAGTLRWAIARVGEAAVPTLAAHLRDPEAGTRRRAIRALGGIDGPGAVGALAVGLEDADAATAGLAAILLVSRGHVPADVGLPEICAPLVGLVVAGRGDVEAAEALGTLAARSTLAAERISGELAERLAVADPAARSRLVQALGEIPGEAAATVLDRLVDHPDPEVSRVARYLVGRRTRGA